MGSLGRRRGGARSRTTTCARSSGRAVERCSSRRTRTGSTRCSTRSTGWSSPAATTWSREEYGADAHPATDGHEPRARPRRARAARRRRSRETCPCSRSAAASRCSTSPAAATSSSTCPTIVGHEEHREVVGEFSEHAVRVDPSSRIGEVHGPSCRITTRAVGRVGDGLREVAWAEDGTVEGLEDPDKPFVVGVLWHPEAGEDQRLFEQLVEAARGVTAVVNPATEEVIAEVEAAGARRPTPPSRARRRRSRRWRAVAPADRARLLRRLATLVEEHDEELARLESRNVGKPIAGRARRGRHGRARSSTTTPARSTSTSARRSRSPAVST